jgi:hypothetical protein
MRPQQVVGTLCLAAVLSGPVIGRELSRTQVPSDEAHTAWVVESLKEMQTIKPGMTRADLLKVFGGEGGLSTGMRRTYVYRACRYFKVDVEFEAVGRPASDSNGRVTLIESAADLIKSISRPYLEFAVIN